MTVSVCTLRHIQKTMFSGAFKKGLLCTTILVGLTMLAPNASAATVTLDELGTFGGAASEAIAVTDTGMVVGRARTAGGANLPFLWTSGDGLTSLGTFGGIGGSGAIDITPDGSVIVGYATLGNGSTHAFRYIGGVMNDLGTLGGESYGTGVSADGTVVVGHSETGGGNMHSFRWVGGVMTDLLTLGGDTSWTRGVSDDGSIVVGYSSTAGIFPEYAFRWTQVDSMVNLGTLGGNGSRANGISGDGSVIIGSSSITGNAETHPFRYVGGVMTGLGTLGGTFGEAFGVSANGSVVVGYSGLSGDLTRSAFRWTEAGGIKDLNTLLSDAGVDMTGITLEYANGISPNGKYIVGSGSFPGYATEAFVVYYDGVTGDVTTVSQQQEATQNLATNQQTMLAESRSTAGQLLGFSRPVDSNTYTYAGGMFGSAVGYTGGQFSGKGVTLLGGIGYGAQDYKNIEQDNATTVAVAGRYTFSDLFAGQKNLSPFVELGGWVTPNADLTMSRPYGTGSSVGVGTTESTSYAGYARGGLAWDINANDKLTGYGELGQQFMKFKAYSETVGASNPFPATVNEGLVRMDVVRAGGAWTHKVEGLNMPVSFTLAGAAAHAFGGQSGLTVNVAGIGTSTAAFKSSTWGEFGAGVETQITEQMALNLNINGTTGGTGIGTEIHGGAGLTFKF